MLYDRSPRSDVPRFKTFDAVAAYLANATGDAWTAKKVLQRHAQFTPDEVWICPPIDVPFLKYLGSGHWVQWERKRPSVCVVRGSPDEFLEQMLADGRAVPSRVFDRLGQPVHTDESISSEYLCLPGENFDRLADDDFFELYGRRFGPIKRIPVPREAWEEAFDLVGPIQQVRSTEVFPEAQAHSVSTKPVEVNEAKIGWHYALVENWRGIRETYGSTANARDIARWLCNYDTTGIIDTSYRSVDSMRWRKQDGEFTTVAIKTMQNQLPELRARGWLPAS